VEWNHLSALFSRNPLCRFFREAAGYVEINDFRHKAPPSLIEPGAGIASAAVFGPHFLKRKLGMKNLLPKQFFRRLQMDFIQAAGVNRLLASRSTKKNCLP
jgi:hypothetical protein